MALPPNIEGALRNGEAIAAAAIPDLSIAEFRAAIIEAVGKGSRIASLFGVAGAGDYVKLYALLADDAAHALALVSSRAAGDYPALTPHCPQAHLFEREIYEQTGLEPRGHPWLKAVRRHDFPPDADGAAPAHPYFAMTGEEVHQVAVGPVHAGVIEPGHFRFQCQGEVVHHLEIHLGYQQRGVEEQLTGGPHRRTMFQMETVAGDTTIANAAAYCQLLEALGGVEAPPRAQAIRAVALELERLANHVGDMGALANDVGFLPTASYCGRLRGEFLNLTALLCGSRLGRGLVRPGGAAFDLDDKLIAETQRRLAVAGKDVAAALEEFFDTASVRARLDGTGPVAKQAVIDLGLVGMAARSCGVARDARADHRSGHWRRASVPAATWPSGDVFARATVRKLEIEHSLAFVKEQLGALPPGPVSVACPPPAPNQAAAALVEGWRGEVVHVAITDAQGKFARYKLTDPSFHNWAALALALRGQQISDFPLCNKSFNLSYCGFDL